MKKLILTFLLIALPPGFAYTLELNSLELCMDKDFIHKISGDEVKKIDELKENDSKFDEDQETFLQGLSYCTFELNDHHKHLLLPQQQKQIKQISWLHRN